MENLNTINKVLDEGKENCCGCYACFNICPVNAITMIKDEKGFFYPKIDKEKCINCGLCLKVCPTENVKAEKQKEIIPYAVYSKVLEERLISSSGGVFSLLAKYILNEGGIVYGAVFNEEYNVCHQGIEDLKELDSLRRSKYMQSEINDLYNQIKKNLKKNRLVLFTGTPCQVEGLYRFLDKDYENLYTQDTVCHGVPSSKVWQKYLKELEEEGKINLEQDLDINFRNKDDGWRKYNFKIINKESKSEYLEKASDNVYMKAFLNDLILRDSCYDCKFKKKYRESDITLSDYWGAQKLEQEFNDDKGLSLITLNSDKGKKLFYKIQNQLIYKETDLDAAIKFNPSWIKSSQKNKNIDKFFKQLDKKSLKKLVKKYRRKLPFKIRIKRIIRKILKKK